MAESTLKNWEVLKHDLEYFEHLEDFQQEAVADYIACPSSSSCDYDGYNNSVCTRCKVSWLKSEWED